MQDKAHKKISFHELDLVLMHHRQWLETSGKKGRRAELNGIALSSRHLFGAIQTRAIIEDVDFGNAYLNAVVFKDARLQNVNLDPECFQEDK